MLDPDKTTIVSGCPGSGKTTKLLSLVEEELSRGTPPDKIAYLSFTRAAQNEAISRAAQRFSLQRSDLPFFRTLHSLGFHTLGMTKEQVLNNSKTELIDGLADYLNVPLSGISSDEESWQGAKTGDRLLHLYNLSRTREVPLRQQYEESDEDFHWAELRRLADGVRAYKASNDLYDYVDMLSMFCEGASTPSVDVVFVDEAQDLSSLQWRAVSKLAGAARQVVVAGDDDQGIFEWAGASVDRFARLKGTEIPLHKSHRVPRAVQQEAAAIIQQVPFRRKKTWEPRACEGSVYNELDFSAIDLSCGEWLVLARNKRFLKRAEDHLQNSGLLYERQGKSSLGSQAAIKAWTRLTRGESITKGHALKCYRQMKPGSGFVEGADRELAAADGDRRFSLEDLRAEFGLLATGNWYDALDHLTLERRTYLRAAGRRGERLGGAARVKLETIHSAKGREADNVVVFLDLAPRTHRQMLRYPEAEHRVFYVGATRAKENLYFVRARNVRRMYPLH